MDQLMSDSTIMKSVAIASMLVALSSLYVVSGRYKKKFPCAIPFPLDQSIIGELVYILTHQKVKGNASFSDFTRDCRKKFGNIFYLGPLFNGGKYKGPVLCITHPEDQLEILRKEKQLEWIVPMPDTAIAIHGEENFQNIPSGMKHSVLRKVYSSILSPKSLEAFTIKMIQNFTALWEELGQTNNEVKLTLAIKKAQLKLMCEIFYGFDFSKEEDRQVLEEFMADFQLTEKALFAPFKKSKMFIDGYEAGKRISSFLNERFDRIFQQRLKSREHDDGKRVGSAMQQIADALIESGCTGPNSSSSDNLLSYNTARENLYLLLEASHGTTMYTTSLLMYHLNQSKNRQCLKRLRQDVLSVTPTYAGLKSFEFGDACIKETMRVSPIIGSVSYHVSKPKTFKVKGVEVTGPITLNLPSSHWYIDNDTFVQAESFIPERFFDGNEYTASEFAKSTLRPFGFGRHICLGYPLANLVLKANLYCFAMKSDRSIEFDEEKLDIVEGVFPMKQVADDFPCKVVAE